MIIATHAGTETITQTGFYREWYNFQKKVTTVLHFGALGLGSEESIALWRLRSSKLTTVLHNIADLIV